MSGFYEYIYSQASNPRGIMGRFMARRLMPMGHKPMYKAAAPALDLKPDDDYLEIAFGAGLFIKKYASHVNSIAGLDYSKDMVKLASKVNRKLVKEGRADFRQGTASQLPWENNSFSAAAIMGAFEILPEPLKSLKELYRVLCPGGRLVVVLGGHTNDGYDHSKDIALGAKCYSADQMQSMFEDAGFKDITATPLETKHLNAHMGLLTVHGVK